MSVARLGVVAEDKEKNDNYLRVKKIIQQGHMIIPDLKLSFTWSHRIRQTRHSAWEEKLRMSERPSHQRPAEATEL